MDEKNKFDLVYLKEEMIEGVTLEEIAQKELDWCVAAWYRLTAFTIGGMFLEEVFEDEAQYYGNLQVELRKRIEMFGGKVFPFDRIEFPEKNAAAS